jgi:hypothetical protein
MKHTATQILVTIAIAAVTVALAAPALAGNAEIPAVYRGDWCSPPHSGPFYTRGHCSGESNKWVKITANSLLNEATCTAIAIKSDTGSHLVTLRCTYDGDTRTVTRRLEYVPRSGDGRKAARLYIDEVEQ